MYTILFYFIFLIGKVIVLKALKKLLKCTWCIQGQKKGGIHKKSTLSPHLQPSQSIKSNKDNELYPKYALTHSKNMSIKECRIAWSINSESSKALRFLSFHIVQNKNKWAIFQALFIFFPTKASLIEKGITHYTSKRAKIRCHRKIALGRWRRIWFTSSSSPLHKTSTWKTSTPPF